MATQTKRQEDARRVNDLGRIGEMQGLVNSLGIENISVGVDSIRNDCNVGNFIGIESEDSYSLTLSGLTSGQIEELLDFTKTTGMIK